MKRKKFYSYRQDEKIIFEDGNEQTPFYSTHKADKLYEEVIDKFKSSKYFNKLFFKKINIFSIIFQDLFWHYCFNFIKYENILDNNLEYLKNLELKQEKKFDSLSMGLDRALNYIRSSNISFQNIKKFLKNILINFLTKIFILRFLIKNIFQRNFGKIWVYPDLFYHKNFNFFDSEKININNLIVVDTNCFLSANSMKFKFKNLDKSLFKECIYRVRNYKLWNFVIYILKPKKIILQDNLFNDFSILLSAKINNINVIGVIHGLMTNYHKGNMGTKKLKDLNLLKYDKIYVWINHFKELMKKNSYLYRETDVFVSGWLSSRQVHKRHFISTKKNNYVLHAFEINSNFNEISKILRIFNEKGYQIILKKRYPYENYNHFGDINFQLVSDFTQDHIENSFCAVCNASTFFYNYLNMDIPIVIPEKEKDGYNFFSSNKINVFEFSETVEEKILSCNKNFFDLEELNTQFLDEFK